jgi:hypothetical protein
MKNTVFAIATVGALVASSAFAGSTLTTSDGKPVGSTYHNEVATVPPSNDVAQPAAVAKPVAPAPKAKKHKAKKPVKPTPVPEAQ